MWTVPLNLSDPGGPDEYREIMDEITRQAEPVPGVRSTAYALTAPMDRTGGSHCCWSTSPSVAGRDEDDRALHTYMHPVSPRYSETLGIELVAGRAWTEGAATAEPVPVVVNETYARELGGSSHGVLGMTLAFRQWSAVVVGVAADNRHYGLDQPMDHATYLPMERLPFEIPVGTLITSVEPEAGLSMPQA